jgi:outer membrane protein assembly factor BamB
MHRFFIAAALLVCLVPQARAADAWPQFRGPNGQGNSDSTGLPVTWSESANIKWKTAIHGKAWSTPVVMDGKVWLSSATEDGTKLFVLCVDATSGKILLDQKLFDITTPQYCIPFNSYASPSPVIEPGRLYVTFGSPGTACIDTASNKVLWTRTDIICNHFRGAGSSPTLYHDLLIMNFDGSDHQFVTALNKNTGKDVWVTNRSVDYQDAGPDGKPERDGDWRKGFSTPLVATFNGHDVLLSLGSKCFYGYEPATGKELWRVENRSTHSGSVTPIVGKDLIYACMGIGKAQIFAIHPGGQGVLSDSQIAWKVGRNIPTRPSPVLLDDLIYMVDDSGIATCIEAATGKEVWRQRLGGKDYSASPLAGDGRIYFFSQDGKTTVVAAGREFKRLADNELAGGFMASPAAAGHALYLRTRTHLYRVEQ